MEIWENIGVVREAMDAGIWLHGQTVFVNGRQTHQVDWDLPDLPYAHLGLPQYETERILTGVPRPARRRRSSGARELRELHPGRRRRDRPPGARRRRAETVRARYLVGVRRRAQHRAARPSGLTFEGGMGMFPQLFMLGDVDLDWSMPEGHLLRFIQVEDEEMKGMLVCVPLQGPRPLPGRDPGAAAAAGRDRLGPHPARLLAGVRPAGAGRHPGRARPAGPGRARRRATCAGRRSSGSSTASSTATATAGSSSPATPRTCTRRPAARA